MIRSLKSSRLKSRREFYNNLKNIKPPIGSGIYKLIVSPYEINLIAKINKLFIRKDLQNPGYIISFKKNDKEIVFRYDEKNYLMYTNYSIEQLKKGVINKVSLDVDDEDDEDNEDEDLNEEVYEEDK